MFNNFCEENERSLNGITQMTKKERWPKGENLKNQRTESLIYQNNQRKICIVYYGLRMLSKIKSFGLVWVSSGHFGLQIIHLNLRKNEIKNL